MSLIPVPAGQVGTVVTFLEMHRPPPLQPMPEAPLRMVRWQEVEPAKYRLLFRRVGARWLWYSRLAMDDAALVAQLGEVWVVEDGRGVEVGFFELDFSTLGLCLIRFLGLVPELAGCGHGKWLFAQLLARAWRPGVERLTVSTCTLDHPAALPAYLRAGFFATGRSFESFPDPRLTGLLPRNAAPQIPLVEAAGRPPSCA